MPVSPIPEGSRSVTPYPIVNDGARALEFYKKAFGARERMRFAAPGGKIGHAEIEIRDSSIMLADEYPGMGYKSPQSYGGTPVSIHLYVRDVDAAFKQAIAAGADWAVVRATGGSMYRGFTSGISSAPSNG